MHPLDPRLLAPLLLPRLSTLDSTGREFVRPLRLRASGLLRASASTLLFLLPIAATTARAQDLDGFSPGPGKGDIALSYSFDSYDEFWVGDEKVSEPALGEVESNTPSIWLRHGFTEKLTVVASLPYVDAEGDGFAGFAESDLQDLMVLGQYRVFMREAAARHSIVLGGGFRTPASSYEANSPVDIGDGTTDALFRAVYLLQSGSFYLSSQVGWDVRGDDAPDGLPLAITGAWGFGRTWLSATYSRYYADGGTDIGDPGFTFPSNEDEYERIGAKVFSRINDRFGWSVAGFTTLDGRNTGDTTGYSGGLVFSY